MELPGGKSLRGSFLQGKGSPGSNKGLGSGLKNSYLRQQTKNAKQRYTEAALRLDAISPRRQRDELCHPGGSSHRAYAAVMRPDGCPIVYKTTTQPPQISKEKKNFFVQPGSGDPGGKGQPGS